MQALDGFSLCLWQLGEADGALAGTNVFALLHRLSVEPDQLLRRSLITAVGALAHPGESKANHHPMLLLMHLPVNLMVMVIRIFRNARSTVALKQMPLCISTET